MSYSDIKIHQVMLEDRIRTEAFQQSIERTVKPEHRVLDFGCGTGVLSIMAALAGAETIYAMDRSRFVRLAKRVADSNGFKNISFYHGNHSQVELPTEVDIIVSEWMGHFVFFERMFEPLLDMRNRYLTSSGVMIPERVCLKAALVSDESLFQNLSFFRTKPYGIDFKEISDWPFCHVTSNHFSKEQVVGAPVDLAIIDMKTCDQFPGTFMGIAEVSKPVVVHGLSGWFEAHLPGDIQLKTGPFDGKTHWKQAFFPFPEPVEVLPNQPLEFEISQLPDKDEKMTLWKWSARCGSHLISMDNFVLGAWVNRELPLGVLD
jgi:SAM-dependent methyltransferase